MKNRTPRDDLKLYRKSILVLILLVFINALNSYSYAILNLNSMPQLFRFTRPPGEVVMPFKPYLRDVPYAGYYTDRYTNYFWRDSSAVGRYQIYQAALSPTMLDVETFQAHDFIIVECRREGCYAPLVRALHGKVVHDIGGHIVLIRKGIAR